MTSALRRFVSLRAWVLSLVIGSSWTLACVGVGVRSTTVREAGVANAAGGRVYDVTAFGARGDGHMLDTDAINRAIAAAAEAGGGTVLFPAGVYPSFSIHLKSNVSLYIGEGATLLAATPAEGVGGYDPPEPGPGTNTRTSATAIGRTA